MATTFSGSKGLAAMVFSPSFPGRAVTSKFTRPAPETPGKTGPTGSQQRQARATWPDAAPGHAVASPDSKRSVTPNRAAAQNRARQTASSEPHEALQPGCQ